MFVAFGHGGNWIEASLLTLNKKGLAAAVLPTPSGMEGFIFALRLVI
jgi:hypothetical protein